MKTKLRVGVLSVIGPPRTGNAFPNDSELHAFGRELIESKNPNIEFFWFLATKRSWNVEIPEDSHSKVFSVDAEDIPQLKRQHPSVDHGYMLNYLAAKIDQELDYAVVLDPDCFIFADYGVERMISNMKSSDIPVGGSVYGMQFPKGYFRDFPALFFLIVSCRRVRLSELDFSFDPDQPETASLSKNSLRSSKIRLANLRSVSREVIFCLTLKILAVEDPERWWRFVLEHKSHDPSVAKPRDTGHKLREQLHTTYDRLNLPVVVRRRTISEVTQRTPCFKDDHQSCCDTASYWINHGLFEGREPIGKSSRALVANFLLGIFSGRKVASNQRFPMASLIGQDCVLETTLVDDLLERFPQSDVWCLDRTPIAFHLGFGVKRLQAGEDWAALSATLSRG